jgi:hypothetical protein
MKTTNRYIHRVHRPTTYGFHDQITRSLDAQPSFHCLSIQTSQLDSIINPEEIRGMQEIDMQSMAL